MCQPSSCSLFSEGHSQGDLGEVPLEEQISDSQPLPGPAEVHSCLSGLREGLSRV